MLRKCALVGGVAVAWLVTYIVMGGGGLPAINLDAKTPGTSVSGQGGPIQTPAPIGPSSGPGGQPSAGATSLPTNGVAALAQIASKIGPTLVARPQPRRAVLPALTFRIATFNVLGNSHTLNSSKWASGAARMKTDAQYILAHDFSIVGFQEMQNVQRATFLAETSGKYALFTPPGGSNGDNAIAFRKDTWELKGAGSVTTPYFGGRPRNHPLLLLRNKQTGISVYVLNVHSPADKFGNAQQWRNVTAQREIALYKQLAKTGLPVLTTGDMNERNTWVCKIVTGSDMRAAIGGDGRNGCTVPHNPFVDWIIGSYDVQFSNYTTDNTAFEHTLSDHPIVSTDVTINSRDFPKSVS